MNSTTSLAVIVGNRGFFPGRLCRDGRAAVLSVLRRLGIGAVALSPRDTTHGSVETAADARRCADLFRRHVDRIDGVLVTLPNFGDERAVADALRWSGLRVPVLVHAFPDDPARMTPADRRDSFCGKISVCNNLRQYGIRYSLTARHTVDPASEEFAEDVRQFAATCRVVRGLRGARIGALGARPAAFKTVRFSEKLLESAGISIETLDLSEILGRAERQRDRDPAVRRKLAAIRAHAPARGVPAAALLKMAKLGVELDRWIEAEGLSATAIQCWTAMEEFYGVVPCTLMSMLSQSLRPSACEVDIPGAVAMLSLRCASSGPAALLDWNNNLGDDPDACVMFHCSNLPAAMLEAPRMACQDIIAGTVGRGNAFGTIVGRIRPSPFTFGRVSTDDTAGRVRAYVGQGRFEPARTRTFGGYGAARIPGLQSLLRRICRDGFEHHVAVTMGEYARAVGEAWTTYMGWDVHAHPAG